MEWSDDRFYEILSVIHQFFMNEAIYPTYEIVLAKTESSIAPRTDAYCNMTSLYGLSVGVPRVTVYPCVRDNMKNRNIGAWLEFHCVTDTVCAEHSALTIIESFMTYCIAQEPLVLPEANNCALPTYSSDKGDTLCVLQPVQGMSFQALRILPNALNINKITAEPSTWKLADNVTFLPEINTSIETLFEDIQRMTSSECDFHSEGDIDHICDLCNAVTVEETDGNVTTERKTSSESAAYDVSSLTPHAAPSMLVRSTTQVVDILADESDRKPVFKGPVFKDCRVPWSHLSMNSAVSVQPSRPTTEHDTPRDDVPQSIIENCNGIFQ
jgi:hypothetical protein